MTETRPPAEPARAEATDPDAQRLDRTIALTQELFEAPTVTAARFLPTAAAQVHLTYSQRSLAAQTKRSLAQTLAVNRTSLAVESRSPIVETSPEVKHVAWAPNGEWHAVFRVVPAVKDKRERKVVEIVRVQDGSRVAELDVTKKHGDWYFDREQRGAFRAAIALRCRSTELLPLAGQPRSDPRRGTPTRPPSSTRPKLPVRNLPPTPSRAAGRSRKNLTTHPTLERLSPARKNRPCSCSFCRLRETTTTTTLWPSSPR